MARTLDGLPIGEEARVVDVHGEDAIAIRLMEMGLVEGALVRRMGQAPMGDPIEYALHGSRLILRVVEANRVEIDG